MFSWRLRNFAQDLKITNNGIKDNNPLKKKRMFYFSSTMMQAQG
jgi:hypothetical protein